MARRIRSRAATASPLRLALAERARNFADRWELTGKARHRAEEAATACVDSLPLVLDATTLCRALSDVGDRRWRQYRYDASDNRNQRRWLLTETDQIIGPLSSRQLSTLRASVAS